MFVLDTNTVIYYFKGVGRVRDHLLGSDPAEVALPTVVLYELEYGAMRMGAADRRRQLVDALLSTVVILPFDVAAARSAAKIRADLETQGTPIGPIDVLIAATALASQATLVTHNVREFTRIPGLSIIDWF